MARSDVNLTVENSHEHPKLTNQNPFYKIHSFQQAKRMATRYTNADWTLLTRSASLKSIKAISSLGITILLFKEISN